jgi:hypothetical protein
MPGLFAALTRQGAQIPLAVFSFAAALAVILVTMFDGRVLDEPIAIAIAVLLVLNGCARLVLWRNRAQSR